MGRSVTLSVTCDPLRERSSQVEAARDLAEGALPQVGDGIEIDAREGVFVVLRTDTNRRTVDVLQMSGIRQIEGGVPLGSVRVLKGENPMERLQKTGK